MSCHALRVTSACGSSWS